MNCNIMKVDNLICTIKRLVNILWNEPEDFISIKERFLEHFSSDYDEEYIEAALEWLIYSEWVEGRRGFFCLTVKGRKELPLFSPEAVYSGSASILEFN